MKSELLSVYCQYLKNQIFLTRCSMSITIIDHVEPPKQIIRY